jgi:acetyl-CoA carboxylase carboxyltransferase component
MSSGGFPDWLARAQQATAAPDDKGRARLEAAGKLAVRERVDLLLDAGSFVEDGRLANGVATVAALADGGSGLPADGVVTGRGTVDGRPVVVVANDPTVKAGSWGARTVEKMVRATETALREELPIVWLVDSAGARITDQVELFPVAAAPGGSSTTRWRSPAACRRCAACSARPRPAGPTCPRSATS